MSRKWQITFKDGSEIKKRLVEAGTVAEAVEVFQEYFPSAEICGEPRYIAMDLFVDEK